MWIFCLLSVVEGDDLFVDQEGTEVSWMVEIMVSQEFDLNIAVELDVYESDLFRVTWLMIWKFWP